MPIHDQPHPFARKTVRIKPHVTHPQCAAFGGQPFDVEDWWDRVGGCSWMNAVGNPACLVYAMRTGFANHHVPSDNEVVYGHLGSFGHLLHVSELEFEEVEKVSASRSAAGEEQA